MSRSKELETNGFILFGSDEDKSSIHVAESVGRVFRVESMPLVQTLTPREKINEQKNTYSVYNVLQIISLYATQNSHRVA